MNRLLIYSPNGIDDLRTKLGDCIYDLHGNTLASGAFVGTFAPKPETLTKAKNHPNITLFPPIHNHGPLSAAQVELLAYAGVQSGHTMFDALTALHTFHENPFYAPELW